MKITTLSAIGLLLCASVGAHAQRTISSVVAHDHQVLLPIVLKNGFPMVEGQVNGQAGYFMFDTGTAYFIFLNNDYTRLPAGVVLKGGTVGSGQQIVVSRYGCLNSLTIAGNYTLESLCDLQGANFKFVADEVEPRFLGFLGYDVFKLYRMTLDLTRQQAVLGDRFSAVEQGSIAVLHFAAEDRQVPKFTVNAGAIPIPARMDTGDPGHVTLTQADANTLLASGKLLRSAGQASSATYRLPHVEVGGASLNTADLPVSIAAEKSEITMGFEFLKNYRSVWDYGDHTVRLYTSSTTQK